MTSTVWFLEEHDCIKKLAQGLPAVKDNTHFSKERARVTHSARVASPCLSRRTTADTGHQPRFVSNTIVFALGCC